MPIPPITSTDALQAGAAGVASALATAQTTNMELTQVLFVGLLGAIAYLLKSCDVHYLRKNKIDALKTIPMRTFTPMSITAIAYYAGTDGFNLYVKDIGDPVWLFIGLLGALNYEIVLVGIGRMINIGVEKLKGLRS